MKLANSQRGATLFGWTFILILIIFFGNLAVHIIPIYIQHFNVISSMKSLKEIPLASSQLSSTATANALRDRLFKQFAVNNLTNISQDDVEITSDGNGYKVNVNYEVRTSIFSNIDAVVHFDHTILVPVQ